MPENLPVPRCSSRKSWCACRSCARWFHRSCLVVRNARSSRQDLIITSSTVVHSGRLATLFIYHVRTYTHIHIYTHTHTKCTYERTQSTSETMARQRLRGQPNLTPRSSALLPVRITTARRPDHIRLSAPYLPRNVVPRDQWCPPTRVGKASSKPSVLPSNAPLPKAIKQPYWEQPRDQRTLGHHVLGTHIPRSFFEFLSNVLPTHS